MKQIRLVILVVVVALASGCDDGEYRLIDPVSCSGLETIRLGADREAVLAAVGTPFRSGPQHAVELWGSSAYDQAARYGSIGSDRGVSFLGYLRYLLS